MLRNLFARTIAMLLIGSLMCAPFAVSAGASAIAQAPAMSSDMPMDSAIGEMPCHKESSDKGKDCPFMAVCMMLCCQAITVSYAPLVGPVSLMSRMVLPTLVELHGINFPPPSRPPKA
jgi:hypothetical protein